jgi:tRNA threonylcarbamoyl adenosine modification protein YeaZ
MILFIDTHASLITIALKNKKDLFVKTQESEYSHSVFTMPMIESIFKENNLDVHDLKKIIVVNGPGSFTGIRIGLSIAKTMAYALKIDINTISSLKAYLISSNIQEDKMAVIEDNKGYYICAFDKDNNIILEEQYVEENNYKYKTVEHKLDIEKIIDYCKNLKSENPHHIKANYVKKIEVENK